jgi:hypothetical protein
MRDESVTISPEGSTYTLHQHGGRVASGMIVDGAITGTWNLYNRDGSLRASVDLSGASAAVDTSDASAVFNKLCFALHDHWIGQNQPPAWLRSSEFLKTDWRDIDDDSRLRGTVRHFPYFMFGLTADEPLIADFCAMRLDLAVGDDGALFAVAPIAARFAVLMLEHAGQHAYRFIAHLERIRALWASAASETEYDISKATRATSLMYRVGRALRDSAAVVEQTIPKLPAAEQQTAKAYLTDVRARFANVPDLPAPGDDD